MYYDYLVLKKKSILQKAIQLLEYYNDNTIEYSIELNNKLINMKTIINK